MRWSHMLGVTFICDGSESMPETTLFWPGGNHHGCLTIHYVWQQAKLAWTHGPWWFRSMWKFETFHVMLFFFSILFCYQSIPLGWQGFQITNLDAFYPLFTKPYSPTQTKRLDFFFFKPQPEWKQASGSCCPRDFTVMVRILVSSCYYTWA